MKLRYERVISYPLYTYGDLNAYGDPAAEVTVKGITLCNEMKLHKQLQNEKIPSKRGLGCFREQFGYPPMSFAKTRKYLLHLENIKSIRKEIIWDII